MESYIKKIDLLFYVIVVGTYYLQSQSNMGISYETDSRYSWGIFTMITVTSLTGRDSLSLPLSEYLRVYLLKYVSL